MKKVTPDEYKEAYEIYPAQLDKTDIEEDRKLLEKLSKQAIINTEKYSSKYFAESVLKVYEYAIKHKENRLGLIGKIVDKVKGNKDEVDNQ